MKSYSENFLKKIEICIKPRSENSWIFKAIKDNTSLVDIASRYLDLSDYDGNYLTSATDALFEAFISFKNNNYIDSEEAGYLLGRSGIIDQYIDSKNNIITYFTVRDLIDELDGPEFNKWLLESSL
jgi:hypothetical protein